MNDKINLQELADTLAQSCNLKQADSNAFVKTFWNTIEEALMNDGSVKIKGFGTFKLVEVEPRESINVQTGERFEIEQHYKISFLPDASMRNIINKPFSHFESVILNEGTHFDDMTEDDICISSDKQPQDCLEEEGDSNGYVSSEKERDNGVHYDSSDDEIEEEADGSDKVLPVSSLEGIGGEELNSESSVDVSSESEDFVVNMEKAERQSAIIEDNKSQDTKDDIVREEAGDAKESKVFVGLSDCEDTDNSHVENGSITPIHENSRPPQKEHQRILYGIFLLLIGVVIGGVFSWLIWVDGRMQEIQTYENVQMLTPVETADEVGVSVICKEQKTTTVVGKTKESQHVSDNEIGLQKANDRLVSKGQKDVHAVQVAKVNQKVNTAIQADKKETLADTVEYDMVETLSTDTIRQGDTLAKIAFKFYGNRKLWPYIVIFNKSLIKNPDNVPIGTVIQIPKLVEKH